jgi:hypothetical protein
MFWIFDSEDKQRLPGDGSPAERLAQALLSTPSDLKHFETWEQHAHYKEVIGKGSAETAI